MTHTLVVSRGDLKNIYSMASLHLVYHSCLEKTRDQSQCRFIDNLFLEQLLNICLSMPTPRIVTPLKEIRTQMSWGTIVLPQSLPFSALLAQDWLQTLIFSGQSVPWKSWPVGSYAGPTSPDVLEAWLPCCTRLRRSGEWLPQLTAGLTAAQWRESTGLLIRQKKGAGMFKTQLCPFLAG